MPSLESLPLELLFHIFSFLLRSPTDVPQTHALHRLYRTGSKELQYSLIAFTAHTRAQLQTHGTQQPLSKRNDPLRSLESLLNFLSKHCAFCTKSTVARARARPHLVCCRDCDEIQFPKKITLTNAVGEYVLKSFREELLATVPHGKQVWKTKTTVTFYLPDIIAFAEKKHGCLERFFAKKEEQKRRAREKERISQEYQARLLAEMCRANGVDSVEWFGREAFEAGITNMEIVRRRVLMSRINREGRLRERVQALRDKGYGPQTYALRPWQQRIAGTRPQNPEDPLDALDFRFPMDEALADIFMSEFGGQEAMDANVYVRREDMWDEAWNMVNGVWQLQGIQTQENQPWAMANYPVLVKIVCLQGPGEGMKQFKERAKKVEKENEKRERIYEGVRRRYGEMIREGRWFKR